MNVQWRRMFNVQTAIWDRKKDFILHWENGVKKWNINISLISNPTTGKKYRNKIKEQINEEDSFQCSSLSNLIYREIFITIIIYKV